MLILAAAPLHAGAAQSAHDRDTLFALTLGALVSGSAFPVKVDPRPLRPDAAVTEMVLESLAGYDSTTLHWRKDALRALGLHETDAIDATRCPGVLVPGSPAANEHQCSAAPALTAIVALPRAGGAALANEIGTDAAPHGANSAGAAVSLWSVRSLERTTWPHAQTTLVADYVFAWHDGAWQFVEKVPLLFIE